MDNKRSILLLLFLFCCDSFYSQVNNYQKWDFEFLGNLSGSFNNNTQFLYPNWNLSGGIHFQVPIKNDWSGKVGVRIASETQWPANELEQLWPNFQIYYMDFEMPIGITYNSTYSDESFYELNAGLGLTYRLVNNYLIESGSASTSGGSSLRKFNWYNYEEQQSFLGFAHIQFKYYPSFMRQRLFIQAQSQIKFFGVKKIYGEVLNEYEEVIFTLDENPNLYKFGIGIGYTIYGPKISSNIRNRTDVPFHK